MAKTPTFEDIYKSSNLKPTSSSDFLENPSVIKDLENHAIMNDSKNFWENALAATVSILDMAGMQLSSTLLALADPANAIPDPFTINFNSIRKFLWNTNPTNPYGYVGAFLSPEIKQIHDSMNQAMDNDEWASRLKYSAPDEMYISGMNVGKMREYWESKRDGTHDTWAAKFFEERMNDYKTHAEKYGQIRTGNETADYWLNNIASLGGSVLGSYLTGATGGKIIGAGSRMNLPAKIAGKDVSKITSHFNNLGANPIYSKLGQAGLTFAQVGGEAVLQGHETRDLVEQSYIDELGGEDYKFGKDNYINMVLKDAQARVGEVPLSEDIKNAIIKEATKNYNKQVWAKNNPELYKKVQQAGLAGYKSVLDFSVVNFALNWTSSGLYIKPFDKTRRLLLNPTKSVAKDLVFETVQESAEEGSTAVAGMAGEAIARGQNFGITDWINAWGTKDDQGKLVVLEQAAWGAAGGFGQTTLALSTNVLERRKNYKAQQEIIEQFDKIGAINKAGELKNVSSVTLSAQEMANVAAKIQELNSSLESASPTERKSINEQIKAEQSKLLTYQAYLAFDTGTTEALIRNYEAIAANENLTDEETEKARQAVKTIKKLEKIYNDNTGYLNNEDIFNVEAQKILLGEKISEAHKELGEVGKLYTDPTLIAEHSKTLTEEIAKAQEKFKDLQKEIDYLKSNEVYRSERAKAQFRLRMARFQQVMNKELTKQGIKSPRQRDIKLLAETAKKEAKRIEKNLTTKDKRVIAQDIESLNFSAVMADLMAKSKAAQEIAQVMKKEKGEETSKPIEHNPLRNQIISEIETVSTEEKAATETKTGATSETTEEGSNTIVTEDGTIIVEEDELFGSPDPFSFTPAPIKKNFNEEESKRLAEAVAAYTSDMKNSTEQMPTFKEFVQDYMERSSKKATERLYNALKEGWKKNNERNSTEYKEADFNQVYNELFSDKQALHTALTEAAEQIVDGDPETKKVAVGVDPETNRVIYNFETVTNNFPGSTAGYSTRPSTQDNVVSEEELEIFDEEGNIVQKETVKQITPTYQKDMEVEPFSGNQAKFKPLANPDRFQPGTKIIAKVHPDANNIPIPLKWPDGDNVGTEMELAPGQEKITFGQALKGVTVKVVVPPNKQDTKAKETIVEKTIKIEQDSDEYWMQVPMIFHEEGRPDDGEGFIHTPDYFNPTNMVTAESLNAAVAETIAIRKIVQKNGEAKLVVGEKTIGPSDEAKLESGKEVTLEEGNPQSFLYVKVSPTKAGNHNEVTAADGTVMELDGELLGKGFDGMVEGVTYVIHRAGTRQDPVKGKVKLYSAFAVNKDMVTENESFFNNVENSVNWAIRIFASHRTDNVANQTAEDFLEQTGYDLRTIEGLEDYLELFIRPMRTQLGKDVNSIVDANIAMDAEYYTPGTPFYFTFAKQLYIGFVGQNYSKTETVKAQNVTQQSLSTARSDIQGIINDILGKYKFASKIARRTQKLRSISQKGLKNGNTHKFATFNPDGTINNTGQNYTSYIRSTTLTDFKAHNVGTEAEPLYTPYLHPTIGFMIDAGQNSVSEEDIEQFKKEGKITVKAMQILHFKINSGLPLSPVESDMVNVKPEVKEKAVEQKETEEKQAEVIAEAEPEAVDEDLLWLEQLRKDLKKSLGAESADPNKESQTPQNLSPEALERMRQQNQRIEGLLPHQQDDMVDVIVDYISNIIGFSEGNVMDTNLVREHVIKFIEDKVAPIKENKKKDLEKLNQMATKYPDNENIKLAILDINTLLNKIEAIQKEENTDKLIEEAKILLGKERAIKEIEKIDDLTDDTDNENEVNHSKTSLQENAREQASSQIRRFLRSVKQYDKKGNLVTNFLGFAKSANVDEVFDVLTVLLADKNPSFQEMMDILKNQGTAYPWLYVPVPDNATEDQKLEIAEANKNTFVGMMERAEQSVKNQFVSLMTKHALKMKFIMYSINKKNGTYTLQVWDTNSSTGIKRIHNDWISNFVDKMTEVDEETGEYVIDIEKAKILIGQFDKFASTSAKNINPSLGLRTSLNTVIQATVNKLRTGQVVNFTMSNEELNEILSKNEGKGVVVMNVSGKSVPIIVERGAGTNQYTIKVYKHDNYTKNELLDWLANVGITLSEETYDDLFKKGMRLKQEGSNRTKLVKFHEMFTPTGGIFGLVAAKLSQAVAVHKATGKRMTFGFGYDLDFNDTIIKKLAAMESKHAPSTMITSWRDGEKSIYGFTPSKFLTDRVNQLKNFEDLGQEKLKSALIEEMKKVGFSKESFILQLLENSQGFIDMYQASHGGINIFKEINKKTDKANEIQKLSDEDHEITKLGAMTDTKQGELKSFTVMVNGKAYDVPLRMASMFGLTMSDKEGIFLMQTAVLNLTSSHFNHTNGTIMDIREQIMEMMFTQTVLPEINRMIEYVEKEGTYDLDSYRGDIFYMFPSLNELMITDPKTGNETNIITFIREYKNVTPAEVIAFAKPAIINELKRIIKKTADDKLKEWNRIGIIETDIETSTEKIPDENGVLVETEVQKEKVVLKHVDNAYLRGRGTDDVKLQAEIAAYDFVINYYIHNANMYMLFAGDPAQYYTKSKVQAATVEDHVKATFGNITKRMALLNAPGNKLADSHENKYIQIFMKDHEYQAESYEILKNILGEEKANAYKKVTETDAQEYTTWQEHLYILDKMGRTSEILMGITPEEIERARVIFSNENMKYDTLNDRDKSIIKKVLQPIKPVYTGSDYDGVNNIMRTVYIKTSSFPLIPQLTKGLEIDKLRVAMEKVQKENPDGYTVRAVYHSGAKVGSVGEELNIFKADNTGLENIHEMSTEDILSHSLVLNRSNFRIQQDVPYKSGKRTEDTISQGTQMTKIMFGGKVISLNNFNYKGKFVNGKFSRGNENVSGSELHEAYSTLFDNLIRIEKDKLYKQLGLRANGLPINEAETAKILSGILKDEAINRNYPKQDIESLELDNKNDFVIPVWLVSNSDRMESLLMAIVEKRIAKIKFPGNSYVAGSEAGFKFKTLDQLDNNEKSGIVWNDVEAGEKGLKHNQILVPSKFRNSEGILIDLRSDQYSEDVKLPDGRIIRKLKKDMVSSELLKLLDFRIPTSWHNSMSVDDIAGFLPTESGDLMVLSRNKTGQKGLDFDVDKENGYQLWHTMTENGKIIPLEDKYNLDGLDEKIEALNEEIKDWIANNRDAKQSRDVLTEAQIDDIVETGNTEIKELRRQIKELRHVRAKLIQNELIKIQQAVLTHPEMQDEVKKILSIDIAKKEADFIDSLLPTEGQEFLPISDTFQKKQMSIGASGKLGIGAYSLDVVGNSLFQQAALKGDALRIVSGYTEDGKPIYPVFKFGGYISRGFLGRIQTLDGARNIADVFSERQNIATDNVKAEVMGRVNLNKHTLDVDKALTMLGFDFGEDGHSISFLLLSQPIIRDYVKEMDKAQSNISPFIADKKAYVKELLLERYSSEVDFDPKSQEDIELMEDAFTNENMINNISGETDNFFQQAVLHKFLELDSIGRSIRYIQTTLNVDSKGIGVSFFDAIEKIEKLENLADFGNIENADKLVGDYIAVEDAVAKEELIQAGYVHVKNYYIKPNTVAGSFAVHTLSAANQLWSKYYPYQTEVINYLFKEINQHISAFTADQDVQESSIAIKTKQKIFKEMKKFLYSSSKLGLTSEDVQAERERLFFDRFKGKDKIHSSLATYLKNILNNPSVSESVRKNRFLKSLEMLPEKNGKISSIRYNNSSVDSFDEESVYRAFVDLIVSPVKLPNFDGREYDSYELAKDMITYAYLEGGIQEVIQFVKFIPISYLKEMPFAKFFREFHNNLTGKPNIYDDPYNMFGIDYEKYKDEDKHPHKVSLFTLQYIQHNPEKIFKLDLAAAQKFSNGTITTQHVGKPETLESFELLDQKPRTFVAVYNPDKFGERFLLFKFDPETKKYYKIPTYGTFGMSEYNAQGSVDMIYPSLLGKSGYVIKESPSVPSSIATNQLASDVALTLYNKTSFTPSVLTDFINAVKQHPESVNQGYVALLNGLRRVIADSNINLKIEVPVDKDGQPVAGKAVYSHKTHTIYIHPDFAATDDVNDFVQVVTHELIHGITKRAIQEYFPTGVYVPGMNLDNAPAHIVRLANLFNATRKLIGEENLIKLKPKEGISDEERKIYGGYDMFEFVAEILTNPDFVKKLNVPYKGTKKTFYQKFLDFMNSVFNYFGIDLQKDSLASQAFVTTMELIEKANPDTNAYMYSKEASEIIEHLRDGDEITIHYVSATSPEDQVTRTIKVEFVDNDYIVGFDSYRGESRKFRKDRILEIIDVKKGVTKEDTINIWFGNGENPRFSNLAFRPFTYNGKFYFSVEHAYQTLKSGEFDQETYDKYIDAFAKTGIDVNEDSAEIKRKTYKKFEQQRRDDWLVNLEEVSNFLQEEIEKFDFVLPDNYRFQIQEGKLYLQALNPETKEWEYTKSKGLFNPEQVKQIKNVIDKAAQLEIVFKKELDKRYEDSGFNETLKGYSGVIMRHQIAIDNISEREGIYFTRFPLSNGTEITLNAGSKEELIFKINKDFAKQYKEYSSGKIRGGKAVYQINNANITLMKALIKQSFIQNESEKAALLSTGKTPITHTQESNFWRTTFPELLTEVRNELGFDTNQAPEIPSQVVQVDHYTIIVDNNGKMYHKGTKGEVTDPTIINKVRLKLNFDPNRVVNYNKVDYYVFPDNTIVNMNGQIVYNTEGAIPMKNQILAKLDKQLNPIVETTEDIEAQQEIEDVDNTIRNTVKKAILELRKVMINYTKGQKEALEKIQNFIDSKPNQADYFLLAGYAGTGKTTILENIANYAKSVGMGVEMLAPTNKAAGRIREKMGDLGFGINTIHRTIYGTPDPKTGEWIPKTMKDDTLYVIDESSMIETKVLNDLMNLAQEGRCKIIFVGDSFQLAPVGNDPKLFSWQQKEFNKNNQYQLTEVKRQSIGKILKIATAMRTLKRGLLPTTSTEDFQIIPTKTAFTKAFTDAVVAGEDVTLLTTSNKLRVGFNGAARRAKFGEAFRNPLNTGEKILSVANSVEFSNSESGIVEEILGSMREGQIPLMDNKTKQLVNHKLFIVEAKVDGEIVKLVLIPTLDKPSLQYKDFEQYYKDSKDSSIAELFTYNEKKEAYVMSREIVISTYGYALTTHKSQGSEWSKVFVDTSGLQDFYNIPRWLYTAITRAKDTVITMRNSQIDNMSDQDIENSINEVSDKQAELDELKKLKDMNPEDFEDFGSLTPMRKSQVQEVFESNPELANSVYEALGFNFRYTSEKWKDNPTKENKATYINIKGTPSNQEFQIKKDIEDGFYSVHFKTEQGKLTKEQIQTLVDAIASQIPIGGKLSTWGEITKGGISGLNRFLNNGFKKVGERKIKDKEGSPIVIPILEKVEKSNLEQQAQQLYSQYLDTIFPDSKVKDIVYHNTTERFETFDKSKLISDGFYFTPDSKVYKHAGNVKMSVLLNLKNPITDAIGLSETINKPGDTKRFSDLGYDGIVDLEGLNEYIVFEPEQIHILGNKQDIEGFKQFVNDIVPISDMISNSEIDQISSTFVDADNNPIC